MAEGALAFRECKFPRAIGPVGWSGGKRLSRSWRAYVTSSSGKAGVIRTSQNGACTLEWPADAEVVKLSQSVSIPPTSKGNPLTLHVKVEAARDVQWHRCIKSIELRAGKRTGGGDVIAEFSEPLIGMNGENSVYYVQCVVDGEHGGADAEIVLGFLPRAMRISLSKVAVGFTEDSKPIQLTHDEPDRRNPEETPTSSVAVAAPGWLPAPHDRATFGYATPVLPSQGELRALVDDIFATHASYLKRLLETSIMAIVAYHTSSRANKSEVDEVFNQGIASLVRLNEQNIAEFSKEIHALRTKVASLQKTIDEHTGRR